MEVHPSVLPSIERLSDDELNDAVIAGWRAQEGGRDPQTEIEGLGVEPKVAAYLAGNIKRHGNDWAIALPNSRWEFAQSAKGIAVMAAGAALLAVALVFGSFRLVLLLAGGSLIAVGYRLWMKP